MNGQISIIIPVYNRGYCLSRCLDSVLNQRYTNGECILVDDASTDDSLQICNLYLKKDSRFHLTAQPENAGVSVARNRGMELAKGEYITFIDSDDWVEPDYLFLLYQAVGKDTIPLCGMSVHDSSGVFKYSHEIEDKTYRLDDGATEFLLEHLISGLIASPTSRLYSRGIIEEYHLRFQPGINWGEDLIFNCTYFKYIDNLRCIATPLYHVVKQDDSLSRQRQSQLYCCDLSLLDDDMKIWHGIDGFLKEKGICNKKMNRFMQWYYIFLHGTLLSFLYTKPVVPAKTRFHFVRNVIKNLDRDILNVTVLFRLRLPVRYYLIYYRMPLLLWSLYELKLMVKKGTHRKMFHL